MVCIPCEKLKRKNKDAEDLELCLHQCVEMESKCESQELDVEIRNMIQKSNTCQSPEDTEPIAQESANPQKTSCSLKQAGFYHAVGGQKEIPFFCKLGKGGERVIQESLFSSVTAACSIGSNHKCFIGQIHSEANAQGHLGCAWAGVSDMEVPANPLESWHILLTEKNHCTRTILEQQILSLEQRQELLDVNKQWDYQFRSMKQLYEKQLTEMKARLDVSEKKVSELEEKRCRRHPEDERLRALGREQPLQEMALLDVLKKQHTPVLGTPSQKGGRNSLEDMRAQPEVLRHQVQIYEEDFRKERSNRERLNEKEALEKIYERLQSQLNKQNSQTKDLPVESERPSYPPPLFLSPCVNYRSYGLALHYQDPQVHPASRRAYEQQQHSPDCQWHVPDQFPPDAQHKANVEEEHIAARPDFRAGQRFQDGCAVPSHKPAGAVPVRLCPGDGGGGDPSGPRAGAPPGPAPPRSGLVAGRSGRARGAPLPAPGGSSETRRAPPLRAPPRRSCKVLPPQGRPSAPPGRRKRGRALAPGGSGCPGGSRLLFPGLDCFSSLF
ncbi:LOW QUALITY PROTEIN: TNFAIP3-interacting protein 3 [Amazona ochrocephala]